jgi:hypothetical protein
MLMEDFSSLSLYQEMAIQSQNAIDKIKKSFEFVKRNNLNCTLIGGMAVAHHVHRSITPDVDFLCPNIESVKNAAQKENLDIKPVFYADLNQIGGYQIEELDTDFLDANKGNKKINQKILQHAITANVAGFQLSISEPTTLAIQKFITGRNKDIDDGFKLLKLTDKNLLKSLLKELKNNLGSNIDAKSIWSYAQFM